MHRDHALCRPLGPQKHADVIRRLYSCRCRLHRAQPRSASASAPIFGEVIIRCLRAKKHQAIPEIATNSTNNYCQSEMLDVHWRRNDIAQNLELLSAEHAGEVCSATASHDLLLFQHHYLLKSSCVASSVQAGIQTTWPHNRCIFTRRQTWTKET